MKYLRIEEHRGRYPIRWMCSALVVSNRGFRSWRSRPEPSRRQEDRRLLIDIRTSFENSDRTYGSPRVLKDLRELGQRTSEKRVARIMQENGITATVKRRFKVTTQSGHNLPVHPNLLNREFSIAQPNRVWLGDITYSAPRKRVPGMLTDRKKKKEGNKDPMPALCCERARAEATVTCRTLTE